MSTAIQKMRDMMGEVSERWALYDDCGHSADRERAEEFERRMALYAAVAQAEAQERQAAAAEKANELADPYKLAEQIQAKDAEIARLKAELEAAQKSAHEVPPYEDIALLAEAATAYADHFSDNDRHIYTGAAIRVIRYVSRSLNSGAWQADQRTEDDRNRDPGEIAKAAEFNGRWGFEESRPPLPLSRRRTAPRGTATGRQGHTKGTNDV